MISNSLPIVQEDTRKLIKYPAVGFATQKGQDIPPARTGSPSEAWNKYVSTAKKAPHEPRYIAKSATQNDCKEMGTGVNGKGTAI